MVERTGRAKRRAEGAFSLIEVLAAMLLLSVTALAVCRSTIVAYRTTLRNEHQAAAMQLARQRLEELAGKSPVTLNDAQDLTESMVAFGPMKFRRITEVTVNSDNSRSIKVTVSALNAALGGSAELTDTFALWGAM